MTQEQQARASGTGSRIALAIAALAALGAAAWWFGRGPAAEAPQPGPQVQASQAASSVAPVDPAPAASMVATPASSVSPTAASASAATPDIRAITKKAMEQAFSPADALRKVQLALGGGTPQESLEAAQLLQACTHSQRSVEALHAMRDRPNDMPADTKKMIDGFGGITNDTIEVAQRQARQCQAFDAATMARRNELFHRAWEGGAEGGASAYLTALQSPTEKEKADTALIAKLQADVRKAAAGGDPDSLLQMALAMGDNAQALAVTPVQRAGYKAAWKSIQDEKFPGSNMGAIMEKAMAPVFEMAKPAKPLTSAEQAEADALAQQVIEAWRRKQKDGTGG
jgi:hypothetical protein